MHRMFQRALVVAGSVLVASSVAGAQAGVGRITVQVDKPSIRISPMFYGLMTEEINHSYDGGLYAELLSNRALKDSAKAPLHWELAKDDSAEGSVVLEQDGTQPVLRLTSARNGQEVGVANDGYWGIPVKPNTTYRASFYARGLDGYRGGLTAALVGSKNRVVQAEAKVSKLADGWRKYDVTLKTGNRAASKDNQFVIYLAKAGSVLLRDFSLFPPTYKNRSNGNRIDLMDKLAELKPSFLRLPGGNYLEGNTIEERFNWKETLGPVEDRPGHPCPWGYRSSDGMGLLEFLNWCEDLKMEPVLAVFAGYALRQQHIEPGPALTPHVQDALDEIEFVTGSTQTKWGAVRAKLGHPKPFPLTYVEIGNEDNFDRSGSYDGRYAQFHDAIKAKYPKLQLIATMPVKSRKPDVIDDHYYRTGAEMARDSGHYDAYDRSGSKIFVGEWASTQGRPTPNMRAALGDAAWLTGLERNSDHVVMEAYAPLLVNVNPGAAQWPTNLIGYDALTSYASPAFHVQAMFGQNTGDVALPTTVEVATAQPVAAPKPHGMIGLGSYRTDAEYKDIEVTHDGQTRYKKDFAAGSEGWTFPAGDWKAEDGALRQTSLRPNTLAFAGDVAWTDYTLSVKARKRSGAEGFMVLFHVKDSGNRWLWNIGGWSNTRTAVQRVEEGSADVVGAESDATIETNRWYDLKVEVQNGVVKCYIDGKLTNQIVEEARPPMKPVYVAASRVTKTGEIVLKVVNFDGEAKALQVALEGVQKLAPTAKGWVLSGQLDDVNSIQEPNKVAPKAITLSGLSPRFEYTFAPYSVTVIRLKAAK